MSTPIHFGRDDQGYNAYAPNPSTDIYEVKLVSGTPATLTLPTNSLNWIVAFSYTGGSDVFVDFTGATAAAPTLGTFVSSTSSHNPGVRTVPSTKIVNGLQTATTISLATTDAVAYVSVELWSAPNVV
jgi:hypothetical protein